MKRVWGEEFWELEMIIRDRLGGGRNTVGVKLVNNWYTIGNWENGLAFAV